MDVPKETTQNIKKIIMPLPFSETESFDSKTKRTWVRNTERISKICEKISRGTLFHSGSRVMTMLNHLFFLFEMIIQYCLLVFFLFYINHLFFFFFSSLFLPYPCRPLFLSLWYNSKVRRFVIGKCTIYTSFELKKINQSIP